jgi:hypothetical protein
LPRNRHPAARRTFGRSRSRVRRSGAKTVRLCHFNGPRSGVSPCSIAAADRESFSALCLGAEQPQVIIRPGPGLISTVLGLYPSTPGKYTVEATFKWKNPSGTGRSVKSDKATIEVTAKSYGVRSRAVSGGHRPPSSPRREGLAPSDFALAAVDVFKGANSLNVAGGQGSVRASRGGSDGASPSRICRRLRRGRSLLCRKPGRSCRRRSCRPPRA